MLAQTLAPFDLQAAGEIPFGHKVALRPLGKGEIIHRLGQPIGLATASNHRPVRMSISTIWASRRRWPDTRSARGCRTRRSERASEIPTFDGYLRADGKVGTRNYVGVLTSVNCSALVARMIADHFRDPSRLLPYPGVDGVVALTHKSGCSVADGSMSMKMLRRTLAGYAQHPNFSGVLLVGLGCEDNQIDQLVEEEELELGDDLAKLVMQETGGTRSSIARGIEMVEAMLEKAATKQRQKIPASEIMVGLQCGGSDSFSGISANPALGAAVDRLVACGGTAILAETPEIYGAENLLLERAVSNEVGERLIGLLEWWDDYTSNEPQGFDNNPSPGNKAGGLTTILEKSLGAVAKGGTTNLVEVYGYGAADRQARAGVHGFARLRPDVGDRPGGERRQSHLPSPPGAARASAAGRRPRSSSQPIPKCSRAWKRTWTSIAATILDGDSSIDEMGEAIFREMIATASGKATKSELLGYGDDEFAPWHVNAWL